MQMRKVLLFHISSSGCCNTLVTMLNNGDFWLSILFHSRVFHPCRLVPRFPLPRFPPLQSGAAFSTPAFPPLQSGAAFSILRFLPLQSGAAFSTSAFSTPAVWCRVFHSRVFHYAFSAPPYIRMLTEASLI